MSGNYEVWEKMVKGFKMLFAPLRIGNLVLKNRITLAPMLLCYGNPDGTVSDKMIEFYARRAKAGAKKKSEKSHPMLVCLFEKFWPLGELLKSIVDLNKHQIPN